MASCTVGNLTIAMQNTGSEKFPHTPFTRNFPRGYRSTSTVTKFDQRTLPPRGQPNNLLICALTTSIAKRKSGTQLKPLPLPSGFFFSTIVDASETAETVPIATLQKASLRRTLERPAIFKTLILPMPVRDLRLTKFPTQVNLTALEDRRKPHNTVGY